MSRRIAVLSASLDDARIVARYVGALRGLALDPTTEVPPPDVPVIYVLRDPRGIFVSRPTPDAAAEAIRDAQVLDQQVEGAMPGRSAPGLSVHFEEVCANPKETCPKIWQALGLDVASSVIDWRLVIPTTLAPWRGVMDSDTHNAILRDVGAYMARHGYDTRPAVSAGELVAAMVAGERIPAALKACLDADEESARAFQAMCAELRRSVEVCELARKDIDQMTRALVDNVTSMGERTMDDDWQRWVAVGELRATAAIADALNLINNRMLRTIIRKEVRS